MILLAVGGVNHVTRDRDRLKGRIKWGRKLWIRAIEVWRFISHSYSCKTIVVAISAHSYITRVPRTWIQKVQKAWRRSPIYAKFAESAILQLYAT